MGDNKSMAGKAFNNIALRILGNEVPFLDLEVDEGFILKLIRLISNKK